MVRYSISATDLRLALPETLWLEPEHFEQAKEMSDRASSEPQQWQTYLNTLGTLAFETWLKEQLSNPDSVHSTINEPTALGYLSVGEFKLCLIVTEHVLDEQISVPRVVIEQPDLAAHFYVALEVLEEQETVVIRGCLRYDELATFTHAKGTSAAMNDAWLVSLNVFDAEINHLLMYIQNLDPSTILLPTATTQSVEAPFSNNLSKTKTRLSYWLQGMLDEGWQTLDVLVNPETQLAWSTRHTPSSMKGGKIINLGMQLGAQAILLLITVKPAPEDKISVDVQVFPTKGALVLPPYLKLALLSAADEKILQAVESRKQDNYIQLRSFKGKPGTSFRIEVSLDDIRVRETFEL